VGAAALLNWPSLPLRRFRRLGLENGSSERLEQSTQEALSTRNGARDIAPACRAVTARGHVRSKIPFRVVESGGRVAVEVVGRVRVEMPFTYSFTWHPVPTGRVDMTAVEFAVMDERGDCVLLLSQTRGAIYVENYSSDRNSADTKLILYDREKKRPRWSPTPHCSALAGSSCSACMMRMASNVAGVAPLYTVLHIWGERIQSLLVPRTPCG
jgi:hypothetical protein